MLLRRTILIALLSFVSMSAMALNVKGIYIHNKTAFSGIASVTYSYNYQWEGHRRGHVKTTQTVFIEPKQEDVLYMFLPSEYQHDTFMMTDLRIKPRRKHGKTFSQIIVCHPHARRDWRSFNDITLFLTATTCKTIFNQH